MPVRAKRRAGRQVTRLVASRQVILKPPTLREQP